MIADQYESETAIHLLLKAAEYTLEQCQMLNGSDPEEMRVLRLVVNQVRGYV